ncbi:unnamed protein product [Caenorhabditis sp. 36 PRJEB53466]|nr:unnamed protein product [Caenorhabditis sp. 36 PRJEB53466]
MFSSDDSTISDTMENRVIRRTISPIVELFRKNLEFEQFKAEIMKVMEPYGIERAFRAANRRRKEHNSRSIHWVDTKGLDPQREAKLVCWMADKVVNTRRNRGEIDDVAVLTTSEEQVTAIKEAFKDHYYAKNEMTRMEVATAKYYEFRDVSPKRYLIFSLGVAEKSALTEEMVPIETVLERAEYKVIFVGNVELLNSESIAWADRLYRLLKRSRPMPSSTYHEKLLSDQKGPPK